MISPSIRIDGFDAKEWVRLRRLLLPARSDGSPALTPPLVVLTERGRPIRALRPLAPAGQVEVDISGLSWSGPQSLAVWRRQLGARAAAALDVEAAERIAAAADRGLTARQDLVEQLLVAARAGRAELSRGLHLDPEVLGRLPIPSYAALQQTMDALLPDDRSAALFVFEDRAGRPRGLYASAIVEKRAGHLLRFTSHRALGVTIRDFRDGQHKPMLDALERRVARPHAAVFCTLGAFRDIAGPDVGALARQVALRGAVIDPVPPWLLALTGIGAAASVAQGAGRLFGRFVPEGIKQTAKALTATPFAALGFDPIAVYAELRKLL